MHLCNDRLRQLIDADHHTAALVEERLMHRAVLGGPHFLQIMPRTECLAVGGKNDHLQGYIMGKRCGNDMQEGVQ